MAKYEQLDVGNSRPATIMYIKIPPALLENCLLDDDATVITTLTNYGYLLYTLNMLKSLQPFGLDKKVLVICIDYKAYAVLNRLGYSACSIEIEGLGKFCPWNTKGYDKICYLKLELLYTLLSYKKNVLLVDGDIVFRMNPMDDLREWLKDTIYDVWIQNDSYENYITRNMCTGYMFVKSSDRLIKLYDCVSDIGQKKYETCALNNNDQTYFNNFVKPACMFSALPLEQYPNGKVFYDKTAALINTAVLVHFNWVQGHIKMAKMKEHKMWLLTPDEEERI